METIPAKHIVMRTKAPGAWFGNEYNMNVYRGCVHGCIYCDSRSAVYGNDRFDTVMAKADALRIIRDDLRRKVKPGVVGTGSMSDPYNPFEEKQQLTRNALALLDAYGFGVSIATKGTLVTRDADILRDIAAHSPVIVKMTVTCMDDALCRAIEPHAPPPRQRVDALAKLAAAGIFCGVLLMPTLPFLCDTPENIGAVVRAAGEAGARFVYPAFGMTLREGNREYYYAKLDEHFPGLRERYQKRYGTRYSCTSPRAKELWSHFAAACDRLGLAYEMRDIIRLSRTGYATEQLTLDS